MLSEVACHAKISGHKLRLFCVHWSSGTNSQQPLSASSSFLTLHHTEAVVPNVEAAQ